MSLARMRYLFLQWIYPILGVGALLPILVVSGFLIGSGTGAGHSISHGELYFIGGSAAIAGSVTLIASGRDGVVAAMCAITFIAAPSYGFWAYLQAQVVESRHIVEAFAVRGGALSALCGLLFSLVCAVIACLEIE